MEEKSKILNLNTMRPPLTDATNRLNYCQTSRPDQEEGYEDEENLPSPEPMSIVTSPQSVKQNVDVTCLSPVADSQTGSNRNSTISAASIVSGKGKRKTHVGPWQLGRTLGRGSTGRVRLAKHALTGQTAAIKIVSKKSAAIAQSESIAAMDRNVGLFNNRGSVDRPMPSGIEREVVIMKLIEHQNVISLYDVWENRGELYLVLEYVEGGELFDYVSNSGPLPEEEAVRIFRQIIAGLGYCHRFNICHRDLKPENILLDGWHNVKLADFGMAALQPEGHWLNTSCGSPHYAAPEIIYGRKYRGDKADIWSCGIILYALLTGYLPFDGGDLANTLRLVKKGDYYMPPELSDESADLIHRILQKKPEDRISMLDMWSHPLLKKYEKLHQAMANHYIGPPPPLSIQDCGPHVNSQQEIDWDLLRNLQTLWHDVKPDALIEKLLKQEPTYERMFYNALVKFRNEQLENYQGQPLEYSASDYHHISKGHRHTSKRNSQRPRVMRRRPEISTSKDSVRRPHAAKDITKPSPTDACDPFRCQQDEEAEKEVQLAAQIAVNVRLSSEVNHHSHSETIPEPKIMVDEYEDERLPPSSPFAIIQNKRSKVNSVKSFQSRASQSSARRPPNTAPTPKSMSYKRNVCFQHIRTRSQSSLSAKPKHVRGTGRRHPSQSSLDTDVDANPFLDRESSPLLPAQPTVVRGSGVTVKNVLQNKKVRDSDFIWRDDARKVSHELSQICEEAFNGGSTSSKAASTSTGAETPATSVSMTTPEHSHNQIASSTAKKQAPLASSPTSYTASELAETRRKLIEHSTQDGTDEIPAYLIAVISHLDRLIEQDKIRQRDKSDLYETSRSSNGQYARAVSETSQLPIISEEHNNADNKTTTQPPQPRDPPQAIPGAPPNSLSRYRKRTIRMVPHSSLQSIEDATPLNTYKKTRDAAANRPQRQHGGYKTMPNDDKHSPTDLDSPNLRLPRMPCELDSIAEAPGSPKRNSTRTPESKRWPWFRNKSQAPADTSSKPSQEPKSPQERSPTVAVNEVTASVDDPFGSPKEQAKSDKESGKPKLGFFRKFIKRKASKGTLDPIPEPAPTDNNSLPITPNTASRPVSQDKPLPRRPQSEMRSQNWFARVFQFKPATRVVALNESKMKSRKEVYKILRKWRQYGLEDVYLDKTNSIIHGKVGENNFLRLRPVEFSAEFYTVLEHGRQANISLVRFRQERGAASSFNKVVDTLHNIMNQRGMLVEDPIRARKMTRILDAFPDP